MRVCRVGRVTAGFPFCLYGLVACCQRHAQGSADGGAGVADTEGVILAFDSVGKSGQSALLADCGHGFATFSQYFMAVGLVPDIPDEFVFRCVIHIVNGDSQLNGAEAGTQMSTCPRH